MRYWGGSSPGSGKCACALKNECREGNPFCNCDAGLVAEDISDDGFITQKEHLPVMELRFGDTGTFSETNKWGKHTLGPLRCDGDSKHAFICWKIFVVVYVNKERYCFVRLVRFS